MPLLCKCKITVKSTLVFKKLKSLHGCSFFLQYVIVQYFTDTQMRKVAAHVHLAKHC